MLFRFFRDLHHFSTYKSEARTCELCGKVRPGYEGSFAGLSKVEFVCEECLAGGALIAKGLSSNEGDVGALRAQLKCLHPQVDTTTVELWVRERTTELEQRTPQLLTWQSFFWPAHCGDYCCFIKEIGKPDLHQLAPDGNGLTFFADHLPEPDTDVEGVWKGVREDSPKDNSVSYDIGVYLFECLHCGQFLILWDCS